MPSSSLIPAGMTAAGFLYPAAMCAFLSKHGLSKGSLAPSGAMAATVVGMGTFTNTPYVFSTVLMTFYLSSSRLTKYKSDIKKKLEEDHKEGGGRTAIQVFSNGAVGTLIAIAFQYVYWTTESRPATLFMSDWRASTLIFAYIGHYACCNGDTWSSELGILNKGWPTLITTFKKVPPGTNGGVSALGLGASIGGGLLIGVMAALSVLVQQAVETTFVWSRSKGLVGFDTFLAAVDPKFLFSLVLAGAGAGFFGSLLDSVLGATVQKSNYSTKNKIITYKAAEEDDEVKAISGWDILDNHQVNFVSSLIIAVATGYLSLKALW
ncbi:Transmembrane protein 19 [Mortierella antarctica]|nr:Transmembrane protein 19 [Mortierella antarctica]KAG0362858.1 Transmembrane protein 19 [Podila minutissima]